MKLTFPGGCWVGGWEGASDEAHGTVTLLLGLGVCG